MNTYKKIISFIISLSMLISIFPTNTLIAYADNNIVYGEYTGTYNSSTPMDFTVRNVDVENGTFTGHVYIRHSAVTINQDISGRIVFYNDHYYCEFGFSYHWWITNYDAVFMIDVYPTTGIARGSGGGGILINSTDIRMFGTVLP